MKKTKYKLQVDLQCGACGALMHLDRDPFPAKPAKAGEAEAAVAMPRFCARCGAGLERYCLRCQKRAPMTYEEWWPEDTECVRTYSPAKRCPDCNSVLEEEREDEGETD